MHSECTDGQKVNQLYRSREFMTKLVLNCSNIPVPDILHGCTLATATTCYCNAIIHTIIKRNIHRAINKRNE
jgi:hypothetical protein